MSVQSEIDRIKSQLDSVLDILDTEGIDISGYENCDDLPDLVQQLADKQKIEEVPVTWPSSVNTALSSCSAYYIPSLRKVCYQCTCVYTSDRSAGTAYVLTSVSAPYIASANTDLVCNIANTLAGARTNGNVVINPTAKITKGTAVKMAGFWNV